MFSLKILLIVTSTNSSFWRLSTYVRVLYVQMEFLSDSYAKKPQSLKWNEIIYFWYSEVKTSAYSFWTTCLFIRRNWITHSELGGCLIKEIFNLFVWEGITHLNKIEKEYIEITLTFFLTKCPRDVPWRSPKGLNVWNLQGTFRGLLWDQQKNWLMI